MAIHAQRKNTEKKPITCSVLQLNLCHYFSGFFFSFCARRMQQCVCMTKTTQIALIYVHFNNVINLIFYLMN